jgi:hypothetical protein
MAGSPSQREGPCHGPNMVRRGLLGLERRSLAFDTLPVPTTDCRAQPGQNPVAGGKDLGLSKVNL